MGIVIAQSRVEWSVGEVALHELEQATVDHEDFLFVCSPVVMRSQIARPDDVRHILARN